MHTTLLIMAAGLGSRYGGNKQIDRMGPHGEILMEYSIFDAVEAGFDKIVFVIKKDIFELFRNMIGDKVAKKVQVEYAFQEYDSLPGGFVPPSDRTKPYGTVHAVLCARNVIDEPFAVINADDYYGKDAFAAMYASLQAMRGKEKTASMVCYDLKNTVSKYGTVTRGVCAVDASSKLISVTETYKIGVADDESIRDYGSSAEGIVLSPDTPVSMNFWGCTPWLFTAAEQRMCRFLKNEDGDPLKKEYVLPALIDQLMHEEGLQVDVLKTHAVWFGVTYKEDKPLVSAELQRLHDSGAYPEQL